MGNCITKGSWRSCLLDVRFRVQHALKGVPKSNVSVICAYCASLAFIMPVISACSGDDASRRNATSSAGAVGGGGNAGNDPGTGGTAGEQAQATVELKWETCSQAGHGLECARLR